MKVKYIPSSWIPIDGRRLDCGPYMSGAREAKVILARMDCSPLESLCAGKRDGMISIPVFKRVFVDGSENGLPLLGNTDILKADLSGVKYVSRQTLKQYPKAELKPNMILITSFGTVGHIAYCRKDMAGAVGSNNFMRLKIDEEIIPSGFVYAFLQSRFGMPLVLQNQSGSIVRYLLPEHIANLPVPRLGEKIERQVHDLVQQAAEKRAHATKLFHQAKRDLLEFFGEPPSDSFDKPWCQVVSSSEVASQGRMEGFFYNPWASAVERWVKEHPEGFAELGDLADVFDVPPFKHIYVEDDYGLPFYPSGELFLLARKPNKFLSKVRTKGLAKYVIKRDWVLLARSGQLGGIIGRPQYADSTLHNATTSDHVIRVVSKGKAKPGYLYAYLALDSVGYPLVTKTIAGKSVPALWPEYLNRVPVVTAPDGIQERVHAMVVEAFESRVEATDCENTSRQMLESCIEEQAD